MGDCYIASNGPSHISLLLPEPSIPLTPTQRAAQSAKLTPNALQSILLSAPVSNILTLLTATPSVALVVIMS